MDSPEPIGIDDPDCVCNMCVEDRAQARRRSFMEYQFVPERFESTTLKAPEERKAPSGAGGLKFDQDKPMVNLVPWDSILWVGKVLTFGAKKYAPNSWRTVPDALERYKHALIRHWIAMETGEWLDPESGLPHWAHIACDALFCCALACAARSTTKKEVEVKKELAA
jgi:hypothetical protein